MQQLKKHFTVTDVKPTLEDFKRKKYNSAVPITFKGKQYWVILHDELESLKYQYLESPDDYKVKENLFGVYDCEDFVYLTKNKVPAYIQIKLLKKWNLEDVNSKRELEVIVTTADKKNDQLLHKLYKRTVVGSPDT